MNLLIILALILAALVILAWWLHRRHGHYRDPFRIRDASASLAEVWTLWTDARPADRTEAERRETLLADLSETTLDAIREDLLAFERRLAETGQPLQALRREIMDSVDRRMLNREILALPPEMRTQLRMHSADVIQTDDHARRYIAANELRLEILREYAARRFGDRAESDWFAVYEQACALKSRSLQHFLQRSISGALQDTEDTRHQAISMVDEELKKRLLQVAPGSSFAALKRGQDEG